MIHPGWFYLIPLIAYLTYAWWWPWLKAVKLALNLPGPKSVPFFSSVFVAQKNTNLLEIYSTSYEKYGPIFSGWLGWIPVVFVLEPKYLQVIMGNSKVTDKAFFYRLMRNFVGEGLISNNGDKWKSHRKYIQPYFTTNILEKFIPSILESSRALIDDLKNTKEVQITSVINKCVFNVFHQAILGIPLEDQATIQRSPFNKGEKTILSRFLNPWLLLKFMYKFTTGPKKDVQQSQTMREFTKEALEKVKLRQRSKWCFLECLLGISKNNEDFTEEDVVNEANTFMLAGQDSVSSALCFTLYYLAKFQDVQEKVMEELNHVLAKTPLINMETLGRMKYLEHCIKESMRLSPSGPILGRTLLEDVILGDRVIPAGCLILIIPIATHRLPHYYPEPEKYDPERFSEENQDKRNPFAYLAFSAGPRNCIGSKLAMMEMKTLISTLLKSYRLYLIPGKEELVRTFRVTIKAKGGIWLGLEARNNLNT